MILMGRLRLTDRQDDLRQLGQKNIAFADICGGLEEVNQLPLVVHAYSSRFTINGNELVRLQIFPPVFREAEGTQSENCFFGRLLWRPPIEVPGRYDIIKSSL